MSNEETPERVRLLLEECAELFAAISKPKEVNRHDNSATTVTSNDRKAEENNVETNKDPILVNDVPLPPHLAIFLKEQLPEQTNLVTLIQQLLGEEADATNPEEKKRKMYQRLVEVIFNQLSEDKVMQKKFGETIAQQLEIVNLLNVAKP